MKYYDIAEDRELTQEEFFDDETPEGDVKRGWFYHK